MHRECLPEPGWTVLENLKEIFIKYKAVLAGGTALALQIGHRISYDLDFFTNQEFQTESLISDIRRRAVPFQVMSEAEGTLIAEVGGVKVSMFQYEYEFLEKTTPFQGVELAGIMDIASMKVIAISQRGTKRDFVDLYVILQETPFHRIADHMIRRFGKERINPVHIGKSLVYFSDADSDPEPAYLEGKEIDWERIKKFFRGHAKQYVLDLESSSKGRNL